MTDDYESAPPDALRERGRALWVGLMERLEFDDHELDLLLETCRTLDMIDSLSQLVERDGAMSVGSQGQPVLHPAVAELRQQQAAFSRLVTTLNLGEAEAGGGLAKLTSIQARSAANTRWSKSKAARGA